MIVALLAAASLFGGATGKLAELRAGGVAAAIGVPNSGKTTVVQEALELAPWGQRAIVYDPYAITDRRVFNAALRCGARAAKRPWWPRCQVVTADQLLRNPSLLDRRAVRLVVTGTRGTIDHAQLGRDFADICQLLYLTHGFALVAEEAGLYSRHAAAWINTVATGGAHFGMRLILLAQRMGRIQKDAREGLTLVVAGAQGAPEDISDLRERCGAAYAEAVRNLRPPDNGRPGDSPIAWRLGDGLIRSNESC